MSEKVNVQILKSANKLKNKFNIQNWYLWIFILVILTFSIYIMTLYPGVGGRINAGDSAKFQFIGKILGIPHPTGYPLYILINFLWSKLPLPGNLAWRINLLSAFFAVLTNILLFLSIRIIVKNNVVSFFSTLIFAFSHTFWSQATEAEVYTFNALFVIGVIYLGIKWYKEKELKYFYLLCFIYAISFGNHLTMITLLPALIYITLVSNYKVIFRPRVIFKVLIFVLIGMLQYSYIYIRLHQEVPYLEHIRKGASFKI